MATATAGIVVVVVVVVVVIIIVVAAAAVAVVGVIVGAIMTIISHSLQLTKRSIQLIIEEHRK